MYERREKKKNNKNKRKENNNNTQCKVMTTPYNMCSGSGSAIVAIELYRQFARCTQPDKSSLHLSMCRSHFFFQKKKYYSTDGINSI